MATDVIDSAPGRDTGASRPPRRRRWLPDRYAFGGLVITVLFVWLSLTPTLLPRGPFFQGLVTGVSAAIGYAVGFLGSKFVRYLVGREASDPVKTMVRRTAAVIGLVGTAVMLVWFASWQDQLREIMSAAPFPWWGYLAMGVVALLVYVGLVATARVLLRAVRWVERKISRVVPRRISATVIGVLVVALVFALINGAAVRAIMSGLNSSFAAVNQETKAGDEPPTSPLRSGGPESLVTWDSLGRQGRSFISRGPSVDDLSAFNGGRAAVEPIRTYAGLASGGDSIRENAQVAADELERAGGFDRAVVGVATTTGTGWINESLVSSLEYMYNGDTAMVGLQYSYLPSWLSFLVDKERAHQAGEALFDAVYDKWKKLPPESRPKLVVMGESLGSFGGESAFGNVDDVEARTDGVLFTGPPNANEIWTDVTTNRDPGSPEWLPVYEQGETVRFGARAAEDLPRPDAPWGQPRMVYLQHPSDPIVWWSPELLLREPDWLKEERGYDVLDSTQWFPFVTFFQVAADMAVSTGVPDGHGHSYVVDIADAWSAILPPDGWTSADNERLRTELAEMGADG
ncbi:MULTISPECIES: alpha/beta hydrolase [Rhodococcus]|uniref:alpha/beta hydrolase n=1 Tax=Rhodococcus TaxID=1827 RepID=UPI002954CC68|nr:MULTISPECIES: alpha/beta-hydrolase family protein [Rhodococcus]MDV7277510.1 alpha/beta-hydrolase family protein [Rhodococcus oxybenzonivorans]MDV8028719.1 alpha/beta-hydrolase family protein [Rhodococcus sp. IEGM 27]